MYIKLISKGVKYDEEHNLIISVQMFSTSNHKPHRNIKLTYILR
jgi:hypothetical protein